LRPTQFVFPYSQNRFHKREENNYGFDRDQNVYLERQFETLFQSNNLDTLLSITR